MIPNFQSWRSTVNGWLTTRWVPELKLLVDPVVGAPMGIQSQNGNGPNGIWAPVQLTAAQIESPTDGMIEDLWAVYQLNEAPYTRYISNGTILVPLGNGSVDGTTYPEGLQTIPPGTPPLYIGPYTYRTTYAPMHIQSTGGLHILGRLDVIERPF